jgi:hypothetical protein
MIDLNKEAEYYAHNYFDMHSNHYKGLLEGYVAGANSKYVEQRILEAQIAVLRKIEYTTQVEHLVCRLHTRLEKLTNYQE